MLANIVNNGASHETLTQRLSSDSNIRVQCNKYYKEFSPSSGFTVSTLEAQGLREYISEVLCLDAA
jgi:hypothetical protein